MDKPPWFPLSEEEHNLIVDYAKKYVIPRTKETNMNDNTELDTNRAFVHEGFTDEELARLNQEMTEAHLVPFQDPETQIRVQTDEEESVD